MNNYYEYLSDFPEKNYEENTESEELYPKAFRRDDVMVEDFQDMMNLQNFMSGIQTNPNDMNINVNNNSTNNNCGLYTDYEGFLKGNMFPSLYTPYKGYRPKEIKTRNSQEAMMLQIDQLCFALIDMNLYLDVHPNDDCMLRLYNQTLDKKKKLVSDYETKYGPITTNGRGLDKKPWAWNSVVSPWERGY